MRICILSGSVNVTAAMSLGRRNFIKMMGSATLATAVDAQPMRPSVPTLGARPAGDPIQIGRRRRLFLDDELVAELVGIRRRFCHPDLQDENLLLAEFPWENGYAGAYASVLEHEGKVMMWYDSFPWDDTTQKLSSTRFMCLAISDNGVDFRKPLFDNIPYRGEAHTNIVMTGVSGSVFFDPEDKHGMPFKCLGSMRPDQAGSDWEPLRGVSRNSVYLLSSADGIRWQRSREQLVPVWLGATQSALWNERTRSWYLYLRAHCPERAYSMVEIGSGRLTEPYPLNLRSGVDYHGGRKLELTTELPIVLRGDELDPPGAQPYTMNVWRYPLADDVYLAFFPMWHDGRADHDRSDMMEVQMAISRDGRLWRRPYRRAVISPGAPFQRSGGEVWPIPDPIIRGDQIWQYYFSRPETHRTQTQKASGVLARAIWRIDRFACLEPHGRDGTLITPVVSLTGENLRVNLDAGASGFMRVGLLDEGGNELRGWGIKDCNPVYGNGTELLVGWRGNRSISPCKGRPVRLRFELTNCSLYSVFTT